MIFSSDGLADLARASVAGLPQLMLDWVDALETNGREADAMAACGEELERVEATSPAPSAPPATRPSHRSDGSGTQPGLVTNPPFPRA